MIRVECECGKVFEVGDQHAGKEGKCPACGRSLRIPEVGAGSEEPVVPASPAGEAGGSSLPWQDRDSYPSVFSALWETLKAVLFSPGPAFSGARVEGTLGESLIFALIVGTIGGYAGLFWQILFQAIGAFAGPAGRQMWGRAALGLGLFIVLALIMVPVVVVIGTFLASGIVHVCLMLVGGANRSFEATFTVVAYALGCTALFQIVPICGGLVSSVWTLVVEIMGLSEIHETSGGRAALAVFLPVIFCCGVAVLFFLIMGGVGAGLAGAR